MRDAMQLVPMVVEQSSRGSVLRHLFPPPARAHRLPQRGGERRGLCAGLCPLLFLEAEKPDAADPPLY